MPEPQQKVLLDYDDTRADAYEIGSIDGARGESSTRDLVGLAGRGREAPCSLGAARRRVAALSRLGCARSSNDRLHDLNTRQGRPPRAAHAPGRDDGTSRASSTNPQRRCIVHSFTAHGARAPLPRILQRGLRGVRVPERAPRRGGTSPAPSRPAA